MGIFGRCAALFSCTGLFYKSFVGLLLEETCTMIACCSLSIRSCIVAVCCSVLQCVAVCYSVLQCVAVCCSVLQCVANKTCSLVLFFHPLQRVAVRCDMLHTLQCIAMWRSALQCVAVHCRALQCVAARCSALQRVAARCSALQRVAAHCSALQRVAEETCSITARCSFFMRSSAACRSSMCLCIRCFSETLSRSLVCVTTNTHVSKHCQTHCNILQHTLPTTQMFPNKS